jgi:hypothetical protein
LQATFSAISEPAAGSMIRADADLKALRNQLRETRGRLTAAQERAFAGHAHRLGHDAGQLQGGAELVSYPIVPSVAAMRALAAATPGQRRRRQLVFFNPVIQIRGRLGQGVHDRLEAAVFADGEIDPEDEGRGIRHFPFPTRILSVRHRQVHSGESWDLSIRGEHWGRDDRDDILNVVNVGSLCLEPGASVVVRGNMLILVIQQLICQGGESDVRCQLAILPTPFSVDSSTGPFDGTSGPAGRSGTDGAGGAGALTAPTLAGARLVRPVVPGAADGRGGGDAAPGGNGAKGRTGGATKIAEITIGELAGPLTVLAAGGRGGDGGHGGDGGDGGAGGHGAPGQRTLRGVLPPGRGGDGGRGGHGGTGGRGGHGGISSNVFVSLPPSRAGRVLVLAHPSGGGLGGRGGHGGVGGEVGRGGTHAPEPGTATVRRPRPDGRAGPAGTDGSAGYDGRGRPAPPVFVNECAVEPMAAPAQIPPPGAVRSLDTRRGAISVPATGGEGR